jgi:hypothetical protein
VSCWAKGVWLAVVVAIVVIWVVPDLDSQPAVALVFRSIQKPWIAAWRAAITAALTPSSLAAPLIFSISPLRSSSHSKRDSFAGFIDFECCRRC